MSNNRGKNVELGVYSASRQSTFHTNVRAVQSINDRQWYQRWKSQPNKSQPLGRRLPIAWWRRNWSGIVLASRYPPPRRERLSGIFSTNRTESWPKFHQSKFFMRWQWDSQFCRTWNSKGRSVQTVEWQKNSFIMFTISLNPSEAITRVTSYPPTINAGLSSTILGGPSHRAQYARPKFFEKMLSRFVASDAAVLILFRTCF